jgi:hypothetical protein
MTKMLFWTYPFRWGEYTPRVDPANSIKISVNRSGGFLRCSGYRQDDGASRRILLQPFQVEVWIDIAHRKAQVFGRDELSLCIPLIQIIEDTILTALEARGAVFLHASAVVADNKAILLVGNKGAGKTTALCRLLKLFDVSKLANDSVVLWSKGNSVIVRGWPSFFKVSVATIAGHEELAPVFPPNLRDRLHDSAALWAVYEKVALFPGEAAELFHQNIEPEAPLSTIILPQFGKNHIPSVTAVELAALGDEMLAYIQGSQNPNHSDWLGFGSVEKDASGIELLRMLGKAREARAFRLEWAPSLDDLLADVPELRMARNAIIACENVSGRQSAWPGLPDY